MTEEGQELVSPQAEPVSQTLTVEQLQKNLETQAQALEKMQTSFTRLQSAKDREVAAANKRAQDALAQREQTQQQLLALETDPVAKRDLILQQQQLEIDRYRRRDEERVAVEGFKTEYVNEWGIPADLFASATTRQEVYDVAKQFHKDSRKVKPKKEVTESTPASTAPSAAPEMSVLDDKAVAKREGELKTIVQSSTATKREKATARKEFLKLRRPGGRGRRVSV